MANKTIGSVMIREIIRMKQKGFSNSRISQNLGKSRTTVLKYLSVIKESGFGCKELIRNLGLVVRNLWSCRIRIYQNF